MKPWTPRQYRSIAALISAYKAGDRPRIDIGRHATERYLQMGITQDEFADAIVQPDTIGYSPKYRAMLLRHGRVTLSILLDDGWPFVATVLYATEQAWRAAYESGVFGKGRQRREDMTHLPIA